MESYEDKVKIENFPTNYTLDFQVKDLLTKSLLSNAEITLEYLDSKEGEESKVTDSSTTSTLRSNSTRNTTDRSVSIGIHENGNYRIYAMKNGYIPLDYELNVNCQRNGSDAWLCSPFNRTYEIHLTPMATKAKIRISMSSRQNQQVLNLLQVNKKNGRNQCDVLGTYDVGKRAVKCTAVSLEASSSPRVAMGTPYKGDSYSLQDASANADYTYMVYIENVKEVDNMTVVTISDSSK